MLIESVRELKKIAKGKLARSLIRPYSASTTNTSISWLSPPALGIHLCGKGVYKLAIHILDKSYIELIQPVVDLARGEVNVQITGQAYPLSFGRNYHQRPISIGMSISHFDLLAPAGTLGCFVKKREQSELLILSNNHILANDNNAEIGDLIIQPAREDGGSDTDLIAALEDFVPLENDKINFVDAAVARVKNINDVGNLFELSGIGLLRGFYDQEQVIRLVEDQCMVSKIGRKTGLTKGTIESIELEPIISYNKQLKNCKFDNIISIEGIANKAFSQPGDSGSIILDEHGYAIALLFAGTPMGGTNNAGLTYAIPIDLVLRELDIYLVTC